MAHHYKESVAGRLAISADPIIRCKRSFGFILIQANRVQFYLLLKMITFTNKCGCLVKQGIIRHWIQQTFCNN